MDDDDDEEEDDDEIEEPATAAAAPPNEWNHRSTSGPSPNAASHGNHASFNRGAGFASSRSK
jgi:hypothetical protein